MAGAQDDLTRWLLDQDPALRWQVERDLLQAPPEVWRATRARVATEGFGARLLALQDPDGQWAGGAFFPAGYDGTEDGQPWTATTWALNALREWGLDAAVLRGRQTAELLDANSRWEYDGSAYWHGEVDCCINGYTIANGAWLGADVTSLVLWAVEHRLADGGWNCEWVEGSGRSSFASTLNVLHGLLAYDEATGGTPSTHEARHAGEEYLLRRSLRHRLSTGEVVGAWVDDLAYPFRWHYSVLRAADYFRRAALLDGVDPDPRLAEAVEVVLAAQGTDGRWVQQQRYPGRVWFDVDVPPGEPSPWLTLYALRVLGWWDESSTTESSPRTTSPTPT